MAFNKKRHKRLQTCILSNEHSLKHYRGFLREKLYLGSFPNRMLHCRQTWMLGSPLISSSKALMQIWACFIAEIFMHCFHRSLFPQLLYPTMQRPIVSFQVFCPLISLKVYLDALNWSLLLLSLYIYHLEEEFVRWSWPQRHTAGGEAGRVRGGETVEGETVKVEEDERRSTDHLKGLKNVSGFITLAVCSLL